MSNKIELLATITCRKCGFSEELEMPTDACRQVWECPHCGERHTPKAGDCCVFCSYADKQCPSMQEQNRS